MYIVHVKVGDREQTFSVEDSWTAVELVLQLSKKGIEAWIELQ